LVSYIVEKLCGRRIKSDIQKLIKDHKAMVECRKRIIEDQTCHASALFHLFEDPILASNSECNSIDNNQNNSAKDELGESENKNEHSKPKEKRKGGKNKLPLGNIIAHTLSAEEKICPCCKNKMHKQRPKTRTYVLALPMLSTETHVSESYRCLSCDVQETANKRNDIANECIGRYHFSAVSSLATLRYQCGMASYRMENMSDALGIKVADSTQWYLFENAASIVQPFVCYLEKEVANAPKQHVDDTHNIILDLVKGIEKEQEQALQQGKDPQKVRSGIHTTNLTGVFPEGRIVLYKTGLHHACEILAQILSKRTIDEQIIIMADAASANTSKINLQENENIKIANCNSHTIRKFKDLADKETETALKNCIKNHETSEYLNYFLFRYKTIFKNENLTKNMTPKERLYFHQNNSLPLMLEMKNKIEQDIHNKIFEPNDETGKVYKYFSNHFIKLCVFCYFEGAPVCNNLSERMLKSIIRHRKNSLFFKTQLGATVADILTSILFTAKENNLNSVEYLRDLLIYQNLWNQNPKDWLPWNYLDTINKIKNHSQ
jgi:transposase